MINKLNRYQTGSLIGMVGEYLYRVEFSLIPLIILLLLLVGAYIDVKYNN